MTDNGAVSKALNCGGSYIIPKGYHNGSGKVTANTLASQTSATATAAHITEGKTAWVNGVKITGTRPASTKKTQSGTIASRWYYEDEVVNHTVTFPIPFESVPTVTVTKGTHDEDLPNITAKVKSGSLDETGFVITVTNPYSSDYDKFSITWKATGYV